MSRHDRNKFKYNVPFTRTELVRRARKAAQAIMRSVVLLDVNQKKHSADDLLLLFYEDWFPQIMNLGSKGMKACPLEFNLFTEDIVTSTEELTARKQDTEDRIHLFFADTGFRLLKFERWRSERDFVGVVFYIAWD